MTTEAQINWHNDATPIMVNPEPDAPEAMAQSVAMTLMAGRTVPDGEKVKRPAWRVKAIVGDAEFIAPNAAKAVNDAIRAKFGGTKFHDVKSAIADFQLPEMQDDDSEKPDATDWTKFDNAEELALSRDAAGEAAKVFFAGEADMRRGLKDLGVHIAEVAESLEKPKAFKAWVESGSKELQSALANKNAKAELVFVGRLPQDWFNKQPETSNSAKAYQRNFNIDKNDIADDCAEAAWGKKKTSPKAGEAQKRFLDTLDGLRGWEDDDKLSSDPTAKQMLARSFYASIMEASDDGQIAILADGENGLEPAKANGEYVVLTQFGTGNRPHELVLAFCKALAANAPEAKAEAEEREADNKAAAAVKPRTFAEYGVTEAAMHLARILSSRDDWAEVLDAVNGMADRAEKETWQQVLADIQNGIDAEKAEAEAEAAEAAGDDDA